MMTLDRIAHRHNLRRADICTITYKDNRYAPDWDKSYCHYGVAKISELEDLQFFEGDGDFYKLIAIYPEENIALIWQKRTEGEISTMWNTLGPLILPGPD